MSQELIDTLSGLLVAAGTVLSLVVASSRFRALDRAASRLGLYVDVLDKLQPGSPEHEKMAAIVADQVDELHGLRSAGRDWGMAVTASLAVLASLWVTTYLVGRDGWWWTVLAGFPLFLAAVCAYGIYDSLRLQPRDNDSEQESTEPAA